MTGNTLHSLSERLSELVLALSALGCFFTILSVRLVLAARKWNRYEYGVMESTKTGSAMIATGSAWRSFFSTTVPALKSRLRGEGHGGWYAAIAAMLMFVGYLVRLDFWEPR